MWVYIYIYKVSVLYLELNIFLQCHHCLRKDQLLVYHLRVDQMQCVESKMVQAHVLASQIMWEIRMKVVVQNVCWIQTVHLALLVYATSVRILVQELVDRMQTVKWWIIYHLALVVQAILETHSDSATAYRLNVRHFPFLSMFEYLPFHIKDSKINSFSWHYAPSQFHIKKNSINVYSVLYICFACYVILQHFNFFAFCL
jgi:hypothetical protein